MPHGKLEDIAERLERGLKTAKELGASAAKLSYGQGSSINCKFEAGRLKMADTRQNSGYGIEVVAGGRKGNADGNQFEDLDEMIRRAVTLAKVGSAAHFSAYPAPAPVTRVKRHSEKTAALPRGKLIDACREMAERLKAYNPDLYIEAEGSRNEGDSVLVTSGGVRHIGYGTAWSLGVDAQRTQGTDILFAGFWRSWREVNDFFDPSYIVGRALEDLRRAEKSAEPPKGKVTLVFPPETLGMAGWVLAMGVNGRNVAKGDSPLKGMLGQKVAGSNLTIFDDPHREFSPGASEIDGDGVPTRRTSIIKNGVLESFLYDLDSAGLAGAKPTGHRGCSPYDLRVQPGDTPHEKLIGGLKDGLYIQQLIGFGQGNIINGDFSCNVGLGFRIRNGEIVGRVKDTMIAGNMYDLFRNATFSSDCDSVTLQPYALCEGATASSK